MAIRDYLIVHYHEVGLKGGNRSLFERALVRNISTPMRSVRASAPSTASRTTRTREAARSPSTRSVISPAR